MLQVMAGPNRKLDQRMEAATGFADRALGKPEQMPEHGGDPETPLSLVLMWGDVGADPEARHGHGH